jgi:hypothetical protein
MELENKINADIKQAMLSKDSRKLEALRAIKAALLLAKTSKEAHGGEIPDEAGLRILQKLIKQRHESAEMYRAGGRHELAEEEIFQAGIIEIYLPKMMTEDEIREQLRTIITQVGATSIKDIGKVMGTASKYFAGKADNKVVSDLVKQLLGS